MSIITPDQAYTALHKLGWHTSVAGGDQPDFVIGEYITQTKDMLAQTAALVRECLMLREGIQTTTSTLTRNIEEQREEIQRLTAIARGVRSKDNEEIRRQQNRFGLFNSIVNGLLVRGETYERAAEVARKAADAEFGAASTGNKAMDAVIAVACAGAGVK